MRDVWMVQRRESLGFTIEAGQSVGIVREGLGQDLDRDVAPERRVVRAVYLPHPAGADCADDFVRADARPCRQRHGTNLTPNRLTLSQSNGARSPAHLEKDLATRAATRLTRNRTRRVSNEGKRNPGRH